MGCRELEPMKTWVKGEGQGCRPCRVAVGVGKYRKVLQDAGQEGLVEVVREALMAEEDTIGRLAVAMDYVKAAATQTVKAALESVDCEMQNKEECGVCQDTVVEAPVIPVAVGPTTPPDLYEEDQSLS